MNISPHTRRYYLAALVARAAAFLLLVWYAVAAPDAFDAAWAAGPRRLTPLTVVWLALMVSMVLRFFPSRFESLGCQKLFALRCRPTGEPPAPAAVRQADHGALWVLLLWAACNSVFLLLRRGGWIGHRFLVCLAGFYGVCDIICILFFCPFQSWLLHNRCCTTCRIFNWDFLMLCTPLLGLRNWFAVTACALALCVLLRWEFAYLRHRERFFESSNRALQCSRCREQLCRYKRAFTTHPRQQEPLR